MLLLIQVHCLLLVVVVLLVRAFTVAIYGCPLRRSRRRLTAGLGAGGRPVRLGQKIEVQRANILNRVALQHVQLALWRLVCQERQLGRFGALQVIVSLTRKVRRFDSSWQRHRAEHDGHGAGLEVGRRLAV